MAISFSLDWGAPVSADQLTAQFAALAVPAGLLDAERTSALNDGGALLRGGMWCRLGAAKHDEPWPDPLEESFGLARECWAVFREQGEDRDLQRAEMVWLVAGMLAHLAGDAALHFQYEVLWLMRRDGRLVVNDREDIWSPELLAMLPQPYERAPLRFVS